MSIGGFMFEDAILKYAAKKLGIIGYGTDTNLEEVLAQRFENRFVNGYLTDEEKKTLWCCIMMTSVTGHVDEDLEKWFEYWRERNVKA